MVADVADTGSGISPEVIEKSLFKPFFTTKEKGLGIGLYHCRNIVHAHGGRIEVESRVGRGSTFKVIFPAERVIDVKRKPGTEFSLQNER